MEYSLELMRCSLPLSELLPQWKWSEWKMYWSDNPPPEIYGRLLVGYVDGRLSTTASELHLYSYFRRNGVICTVGYSTCMSVVNCVHSLADVVVIVEREQRVAS